MTMNMPPEKVAVLCITGVIAILVSVTLLNSAPDGPGRARDAGWKEADPDDPWEVQGGADLDREDVVAGGTRTVIEPRPARSGGSAGSGAASGRGTGGGAAGQPSTPPRWTVRSGDTVERISRKVYGTRRYIDAILAANPGVDPRRLQLGQVLDMPDVRGRRPVAQGARERGAATPPPAAGRGRWYRVRSGDRLETIARATYGRGSRWRSIWDATRQRLRSPHALKVGQRLWLPAS